MEGNGVFSASWYGANNRKDVDKWVVSGQVRAVVKDVDRGVDLQVKWGGRTIVACRQGRLQIDNKRLVRVSVGSDMIDW